MIFFHLALKCEANSSWKVVLQFAPNILGSYSFQITWFDDDRQEVIERGIQTVQELMEDGKRFKTISVLRFEALDIHDGKNITCQAQNSADRQPHSASIRYVQLSSNAKKVLFGMRLIA